MRKSEYWIGVDLHTRVIQVCVQDAEGDVVHEERVSGDSLEVGLDLVERLAERFPNGNVVVEAVGVSRWFVAACAEQGLSVTVAHAARLDLKCSGRKTDLRDARELARRHRLGDIVRHANSYHASDEEYGWRQLLRRRHSLVSMRTSVISQIRALLRSHREASPKGDLYGPRNFKALQRIRLKDRCERLVLRNLLQVLASTHRAVMVLSKKVDRLSKQDERMAPLRDMPYVGPITSCVLVAELGDPRRFRNSKTVASYAGLCPQVSQSGDRAFNGRIVRHGNRELRFVLGEWAVQLLAKHPVVKAWAEARLKRAPKNKVRVALARKLLVGVWHTMRTGEVFSLERCLATA